MFHPIHNKFQCWTNRWHAWAHVKGSNGHAHMLTDDNGTWVGTVTTLPEVGGLSGWSQCRLEQSKSAKNKIWASACVSVCAFKCAYADCHHSNTISLTPPPWSSGTHSLSPTPPHPLPRCRDCGEHNITHEGHYWLSAYYHTTHTHTYTHMHTSTPPHARIHTHTHTCTHMHTTCTHTHTYTHMHTSTPPHARIHTHTHTCTHMHAYTHIHTHAHHMHAHTYRHTHTHAQYHRALLLMHTELWYSDRRVRRELENDGSWRGGVA